MEPSELHLSYYHPHKDKVMEYEGLKIAEGVKCTQGRGEECKACSGHAPSPTSPCLPHQKDEGQPNDTPGDSSHVTGLSPAI